MAKDMDEGKIFAFLAYFLSIIGFLIVLLAKKDNKFAMYHAKQSLVLFVASVVVFIARGIVSIPLLLIPILGWAVMALLWFVGYAVVLVFVVLGIINALTGKEKPLPVIGGFADKIKL